MQTIKKPDEVTVSPHHATSTPYRFDFIVMMLEEKDTFFVRQGRDSDEFASTRRHGHSTANRSLLLMSRPGCGGITWSTEVISNTWLVREAAITAAIRTPSA